MSVIAATPSAHPFAEADGPPLRLAFVGQTTYFASCSLQEPAAGILPAFIEFRAGADAESMLASLRAFDPDVVLVFRPEIIPAGAFADLGALTIGFLTEPIPRAEGSSHPDLERRLEDLRAVDSRELRPDRLLRPADGRDGRADPARLAVAPAAGRRSALPRDARAQRPAEDALRRPLDPAPRGSARCPRSTSTTSSTSRTG